MSRASTARSPYQLPQNSPIVQIHPFTDLPGSLPTSRPVRNGNESNVVSVSAETCNCEDPTRIALQDCTSLVLGGDANKKRKLSEKKKIMKKSASFNSGSELFDALLMAAADDNEGGEIASRADGYNNLPPPSSAQVRCSFSLGLGAMGAMGAMGGARLPRPPPPSSRLPRPLIPAPLLFTLTVHPYCSPFYSPLYQPTQLLTRSNNGQSEKNGARSTTFSTRLSKKSATIGKSRSSGEIRCP